MITNLVSLANNSQTRLLNQADPPIVTLKQANRCSGTQTQKIQVMQTFRKRNIQFTYKKFVESNERSIKSTKDKQLFNDVPIEDNDKYAKLLIEQFTEQ